MPARLSEQHHKILTVKCEVVKETHSALFSRRDLDAAVRYDSLEGR